MKSPVMNPLSIRFAAFLLLPFLSHNLQAQTAGGSWDAIHHSTGQTANDWYGYAVCGAGDIDQDGFADYAIGASGDGSFGPSHFGVVYLRSGRTGYVIRTYQGSGNYTGFGNTIQNAGDIDGDGVQDLIVGASYAGPIGAGSAYVYSGATGLELYRFDGMDSGDQFGRTVNGAGDVDGDGIGDLVVGAPFAGNNEGRVYVYSGATGIKLRTLWLFGTPGFGHAVSGAGDVDGDGLDDIVISTTAAFGGIGAGNSTGTVFAYSVATGNLITQVDGQTPGGWLGWAIGHCGDIDQDGLADLMFTIPNEGNGIGRIVSSATGAVLLEVIGSLPFGGTGSSIDFSGDVNGDGTFDFILGRGTHAVEADGFEVFSGVDGSLLYNYDSGIVGQGFATARNAGDVNRDGRADVIFGTRDFSVGVMEDMGVAEVISFDPYLTTSHRAISAAAGGIMSFDLEFPVEQSGNQYRIIASNFGTGPFTWRGLEIPLSAQGHVWNLSSSGLSPSWFSGGEGQLNTQGRATASAFVPTGGLTAYIGQTVYFSAVSYQLYPNVVGESASAAVALTILP